MSYIPFTDEQKLEANSVDLAEFLRGRGEALKRQGREYLWLSHPGVTVSGNRWYSNYDHEGGYPVKFLQKFFNVDYVEAMTELLGGHLPLTPVEFRHEKKQTQKQFCLPQAHTDMRRVYAYLMKQRCIDREIVTHFAKSKALYEDARHNAVFVGFDETGAARSAHKKGTLSDVSYRRDVAGSADQYGFGHVGNSQRLYVFEAPIDLLSYLTLYPDTEWEHSYTALGGVSEHAMLQALEQSPGIKEVYLCLDHDPAGIEACGRLADILREKGYGKVYRVMPELKDWNEMLKAQNGMEAIPGAKHPKIEAMRELCRSLAAEQPDTTRPYKKLFDLCGQYLERHNPALLYPASKAALFCIGDQLQKAGKPATAQKIAARLFHSYQPYRDHGGQRARDGEIAACLARLKQEMSPTGIYTAQQRASLAQSFMTLAQSCLTAHLYHGLQMEQAQTQKQESQQIAM